MLELQDFSIQDKSWMQPLLDMSGYRSEEYSFTFMHLWKDIFNYRVARLGDYLIMKADSNRPSYLYPPGSGDIAPVLEALRQDAADCGHGFFFHTVLAEQSKTLEMYYPGQFEFLPLTDYDDYIYDAQSLITLAGKKLHAKRNHINRFKLDYPDWTYEPITPENMPEVMVMSDEWCRQNDCKQQKSLQQEACATAVALRDFFLLGMDGGLIRANGNVVAFSMGDKLTHDTYLVHIEKAFAEVQGAYAIINQQFAEHHCADYLYIDREDDSGQEGLRKAKLSYRPAFKTEKYAARFKW